MAGEVTKVVRSFFDKEKVTKALDRKTRRIFMRYGGRIRKYAQFSMRSRKGSASPGSPPHAHGEKLLKRLLFFSYEDSSKSVVIGPVLLERTKEKKIPRLMEEGGIVTGLYKGKTVQKRYRGNPFMKPAFEANIGGVTAAFKGKLEG